jgi:hypothetical protein
LPGFAQSVATQEEILRLPRVESDRSVKIGLRKIELAGFAALRVWSKALVSPSRIVEFSSIKTPLLGNSSADRNDLAKVLKLKTFE